jgi:hypothetical protein
VVDGFTIHFKVKKSGKASKERWEEISRNPLRLSQRTARRPDQSHIRNSKAHADGVG